jgi:hypothetical protein
VNERLARLVAVVRADFLIRLRRPSTAIVFLLLSAVPYLWIPDPASGRALIVINGKRAIYNSAAIGMGTASIGTLLIGLFGFYVISNAIRRDVLTRCGFVIASTTMRGSEYIIGKFAGNVVFLTVFTLGFMTTSMAMVLVRGESALEPLVFARQYLLLLPPAIMFVSALAILFESVKWLSGKFGDVLYFFVWLAAIGGVVATLEQNPSAQWATWFDVSGMGVVMHQMRAYYATNSLSIGASNFDAAKGTMIFPGLRLGVEWILPRLGASLWPVALLGVARLFFHRFDPARVRAAATTAKGTWLGRFNAMAKPFARLFLAPVRVVVNILPRTSLAATAAADALTSFAAFPLAVVGVIVFAIMALSSSSTELFTGALPIAFAGVAVTIADVASREKRAGTTALVFATPHLRTRFVFWKFASALLLATLFLAIPLARAIAIRPTASPALLVGLLFTCAAATALGVVSGNPKTFIVGFLSFWYLVTNDRGHTPTFDFAGFYGAATPAITAAYAAAALALLAAAHLYHARELRTRW